MSPAPSDPRALGRASLHQAKALHPARLLLLGLVGLGIGAAAGCKKGPVLQGPPSAGNGVDVSLVKYDYDEEDLELRLSFHNKLDHDVVVDRNQIAIVGPKGAPIYADDDHDTWTIRPGTARVIEIDWESPYFNFEDVPGVFVRFDGVYYGTRPVDIPPMPLGNPTHDPGVRGSLPLPPELGNVAYASASPPSSDEGDGGDKPGLFGKIRRAIARKVDPKREDARKTTKGLQEYQGPRYRIGQAGLKVAAMPLRASGVADEVAFIMDDLLLTELQSVGFEAIGPEDINAMIGFEGMKDQVGCDDASCAAEIGNALGVPYLTAGSVAALDGSTVLTLKLINVQDTSVVARVSRIADGGTNVLPRVIAEAVQEMVQRSKL